MLKFVIRNNKKKMNQQIAFNFLVHEAKKQLQIEKIPC